MKKPTIPTNEKERLEELETYGIIGAAEEDDYDFITSMAAQICGTKISLISIVTEDKQWFLSHHGLEIRETSKDYSFCAHAINTPDKPFIIEDARNDERFFDNPFTTGEPYVIFYAGVPLVSENGLPLGTLCVIDDAPKKLSESQLKQLKKLATQAVRLLELRRNHKKLRQLYTRLKVISSNSPDLLILVDENQKLRYINRVLHGFEMEKVMGDDVLNYIFPDYRQAYQQWLVEVFRTGETIVREVKAMGELGVETLYQITFIRIDGQDEGNLIYINAKDITEARKNELLLQKNTSLLLNAQIVAKIGSWELDIATNEVVWTEELYNMYGFDPTLPPPPYTEHKKLFTLESWEQLSSSLALTREKGIPYELELRTIRKDGKNGWMWVRGEALFDENKHIVGLRGVAKDITESKKTELILQESEKKFRELFENLIDEVHLWKLLKDETGKIIGWQLVDANPAALKSWGKSISQIIGKTANEIFGSDAHAQFMPIVEEIFKTGKPHKWEEYFAPTEQYLYMESIPFGDHFISTGKDITEQKKAEQALKESELRFAVAIEGTEAGIWDWDMVHNKVVFSQQWKAMLGYEDAEIENSFEGWKKLWHPDDASLVEKAVTEYMNGISEKYEVIHRCLHKNGQWRWMMTRGKILRDAEGKPYRWVGTNVDITPQKQAEEDQKIAKEQAEKASKAKSEFLANMSHEIRTPLNGVIGFTELLKNTPLSSVQQQYVNSANVSGHTLLGIINDILDFSKIEAGMLELEAIKTDMVELLENSIDIVKFTAEDKGLELLLNIDPAMPRYAYIDPIRTKQILANLLGNAVKFTKNGEVELKVSFQSLDDGQGKLSVFVRDSGIGISEEQKAKLFKSFSQADSSTTRKFGGTGLGLVISQMIAEKMGSKISIDSTLHIGTTFYFDIIAHFEEGEKLDTTQIVGVKNCLIIDDNASNRLILEQMLKQWQIVSDSCDNGFEALKKIEKKEYDVIICDYNMPYMDGLDTIRMMKNKLKLNTEKHPIILLYSSLNNAELNQKCEELGIRFRLNKPVKSHDLFSYLSNLYQVSKTIPQQEKEPLSKVSDTDEKVRIIIAEDEPLNMFLSKTILSQLLPNSEMYEAKNGLHAIEQYKNITPDLVFMDVQMPELDGIEATKQIRQLEAKTGGHVPIIALTAGALKAEKDKCLAAGMDDFLTKPLDTPKIQVVLNKYFQQGKKVAVISENINTEYEIHFGYSELVKNLENDMEAVRELISLTLENMPTKISHIAQACNEMDTTKIKAVAHALKGASLATYCKVLADIAEKMEYEAKANVFANMNLLLTELKAEWEIVKNILLHKIK